MIAVQLHLESATRDVLCRKVFLKISQNSQEKPVPESLFNEATSKACNFIKKETMTQVFSCKYCETYKNSFFYRTPRRWMLLNVASYYSDFSMTYVNRNYHCFGHMDGVWRYCGNMRKCMVWGLTTWRLTSAFIL